MIGRFVAMQNIVRLFKQMNWQIPVFGAIMINEAMDKVLLTQTFIANNKGGAWMFPRGKVEKKDHGNSFDCACREVCLRCLDTPVAGSYDLFCFGLLNKPSE